MLVVDDHRLVFYLDVLDQVCFFDGYVNERDVSSEQPRPVRSRKTQLRIYHMIAQLLL